MTEHERELAERGRVAAERVREQSMRKVYVRVATLFALPLALVALAPSIVGLVRVHQHTDRLEQVVDVLEQEIHDRCHEGRVNRDAIRSTVTDGLAALGYRYDQATDEVVPHGPSIDYYGTHPEEREEALARARRALERFPPIRCETDKETAGRAKESPSP